MNHFRGRKETKSAESHHTMGERVYWKHKRNTGNLKNIRNQAHNNLGTAHGSLTQREELGSQDPRLRLPQCPDTKPLPAFPSMLLVLDKELRSFSIHQGFWKRLGSAQSSTKKRLEFFSD